MGSRFPESGIAAILDLTGWNKNVEKYIRDTGRMNKADAQTEKSANAISKAKARVTKAISDVTQKVNKATTATASFGKKLSSYKIADIIPKGIQDRLKGFSEGIGTLVQKMNFLPPSIRGVISGLGGLSGSLGGAIGKINLAVAAAVALTAAFVGLGLRGAAMPGVIQAFDITARKAGTTARVLIGDLRNAARGTINDMTLMKTANLALAGATDQVALALGEKGGLAELMQIARAQARATGQSVDYLFTSLVQGVKRSSPLLIDNTGIVLKVGNANEAMAKSLGKSTDELTAAEKQLAILNATLEAGRPAVEAYGSGALQASERIAQINTTIANTLDRLALSVQPAFNFVLAIANTGLNVVVAPFQVVAELIYEVSDAIFGPLTRAWESITSYLSSTFAPLWGSIRNWLIIVVTAIRGVGIAFDWLLKTLGKILKPVTDLVGNYLIKPLAKALDPVEIARRAGNMIAALGQGLLWAANKFVYPAVIAIATIIADFLMGFSPPKRGPLSKIDQGGANVALAWLEGFAGVALTPVEEMAARVNEQLGDIGSLTHDQVALAIARLDAEIQPFIDNLEIVKAKFEAIVTPLKEASEIMNKRIVKSVKGFFAGELSAEQLRVLDEQNASLQAQLNTYEGMSDQAQYQLSLAKSRQAIERVLLGIQLRRTEVDEKKTKKLKKAKLGASTDAGTGGGGDATATDSGGGFALPTLGDDAVGSFLGISDDDIKAFWGDMGDAFTEGFESPGFAKELAQFTKNNEKLGEQFDRIGDTPMFEKLSSGFDKVFGDGPDSIRTKVSNAVSDITTYFTVDLPAVFDGFSLDALGQKFDDAISSVYSYIIGGGGREGPTLSLKSIIESIPSSVQSWLEGLWDNLQIYLVDPFGDKIADIWDWLTNPEREDSLAFYIRSLPGKVAGWFAGWEDALTTWFFDPASGLIEGVLSKLGAIEGAVRRVLDLLPGGGSGDSGPAPPPDSADSSADPDYTGPMGAAKGARVRRGERWIVGEEGWEFFEPDQNGRIIPHAQSVRILKDMLSTAKQLNAARPWAAISAAMSQTAGLQPQRPYVPPPVSQRPPQLDNQGNRLMVSQTFNGNADPAALKRSWYELQALGVT